MQGASLKPTQRKRASHSNSERNTRRASQEKLVRSAWSTVQNTEIPDSCVVSFVKKIFFSSC